MRGDQLVVGGFEGGSGGFVGGVVGEFAVAGAAWDEVEVEMEDFLAGGDAVGLEHADAVDAQALRENPSGLVQRRSDCRDRLRCAFGRQIANVTSRQHQRVPGAQRSDVEERARHVVLVHESRRQPAAHDVAEDARVVHCHSLIRTPAPTPTEWGRLDISRARW